MSRNNEDRLGLRVSDTSPPPSTKENKFSFTTPTEIVCLPSKGRYYPEGHPCHNKEEVEIRHMTAKDEDILSSSALMKKGIAVERFLQNIIIDKSIQLDSLLIGDKNALMVAARITGYGEDYDVNVTCPNCYSISQNTFRLDDLEPYCGDEYEEFGFTATESGTFMVDMPISKVTLEITLMTGKDENYLVSQSAINKKKGLPESTLTDQFARIIASVDGDSSTSKIRSYINSMPARDSRFLRTNYQKIVPNIDMKQSFACDTCGWDQEVDVPFTAEFFWPKQ